VSDERREHHSGDEKYGRAQQDHIDGVTHVIDDDGALNTQGVDRPDQLAGTSAIAPTESRLSHGLLYPPDLGGPPADRICDASPKPCRRKQA
jgi:hypothetical protein